MFYNIVHAIMVGLSGWSAFSGGLVVFDDASALLWSPPSRAES